MVQNGILNKCTLNHNAFILTGIYGLCCGEPHLKSHGLMVYYFHSWLCLDFEPLFRVILKLRATLICMLSGGK